MLQYTGNYALHILGGREKEFVSAICIVPCNIWWYQKPSRSCLFFKVVTDSITYDFVRRHDK